MRFLFAVIAISFSLLLFGQSIEKQAKKESKALEKEGWKPVSSDQPIYEQIEQTISLNYTSGKDFYIGNGDARSNDFGISAKAARADAQIKLASTLSSEVSARIASRLSSGLDKTDEEFLLTATINVLASIKTDLILHIYRYDDAENIYYARSVVKVDKQDFLNRLNEQVSTVISNRLNVDQNEVDSIIFNN